MDIVLRRGILVLGESCTSLAPPLLQIPLLLLRRVIERRDRPGVVCPEPFIAVIRVYIQVLKVAE